MRASIIILLFCVCCLLICLVIYYRKKEQRLSDQIQKMLDDAVAGKFQEDRLDESRISVIENNMWRYLRGQETAVRKLAEEKEQMQTQISDISHQAVIPISNIVLYSQLLEEQFGILSLPEKQEIKEEAAAIREQARTLDFLIESLVKLSRLETGIIHVSLKKQSLKPVMDAVKKQFQAIALQKELRFDVPDTEETAVFDLKWTIEALANIVDNAMKYTPYGGSVSIRVLLYTALVRVDVADSGIGIAEAEQANVFTRFYRSEAVSDRPGVGIGLYLAREIMRAQNGYIKLSSKPGQGSVFSLFFLKEEISQK